MAELTPRSTKESSAPAPPTAVTDDRNAGTWGVWKWGEPWPTRSRDNPAPRPQPTSVPDTKSGGR